MLEIKTIRRDFATIEKKVNYELGVLSKSFEEYKNPIINEISKLKNENKSYERELERYKMSLMGNLYTHPKQQTHHKTAYASNPSMWQFSFVQMCECSNYKAHC